MKIDDRRYRIVIERLVFFIICVLAAIALSMCATPLTDGSKATRLDISENPRQKLALYYQTYSEMRKVEFFVCLYGAVRDGTLYVTDVEFPPQIQTPLTVNAATQLCSRRGRVGYAHSHIIPKKTASSTDSTLLATNPEPVHLIIYAENDTIKYTILNKPKEHTPAARNW